MFKSYLTTPNIYIVSASVKMGDMTTFNIDNGYFEGLVRGYRSGILKRNDYHNLVECETLDGKIVCSWTVSIVVV